MDAVVCRECDHEFRDGADAMQVPREPCPNCGATARTGTFIEDVAIGTSLSVTAIAQPNWTWMGQWRRMLRSFEAMTAPPTSEFVFGKFEDVVVHFFQDAWHLKDWLRNDPSTAGLVGDIEDYVNDVVELRIVADVANGTKHLSVGQLRSTRTGDKATAIGVLRLDDQPVSAIGGTFEIVSDGVTRDATVVANAAIDAWRRYIQAKGLQRDPQE